jgi:ribose 5-phosphate isomerase B
MMTIHLATDHAGYSHKLAIAEWLLAEGFAVVDYGAYVFDPEDDFPDFIAKAAHAVAKNPIEDRAIIFGGSGQGEAMLANRFPGVRATVLYSDVAEVTALSRAHNDANVLSVGTRFLSVGDTKKHIWNWLHAPGPVEEKYLRRDKKIDQLTRNLHT